MLRTLLAAVVGWVLLSAAAFAETRVALVIGNSAYKSVNALTNPVNDATDLAAALGRIGFDVTLATDLDGSGMRSALRDFRNKADGADMALVYFAGHGIEIDKENYLIPVDADLETDSDVMFDTIPLDLVTEAVNGATTLRMVLLDACRNNPFLGQIRVADSGRSIGRGLSPFEPTGGTLVAFSAKGGTVALDGNGRNSPFMKGLLANLEQPGLDVNLLFRKVRDSVLAETNNRQEPFTYGSLPGREIYLVPPVEVAEVAPPPAAPAPVVQAPAVGSPEEEFAWSLIGEGTPVGQIQKFIQTFPRGVHVEEAFALLDAARNVTATPPAATTPPATESASVLAAEPTTPPASEVAPPAASTAQTTPVTAPAPVATPAEPAVPDVEVAALEEPRSATPADATPEPIDNSVLIIAIQKELRRAGCNPGPADGIWGPRSARAVTAFGRDGDIRIASTEPSQRLLEQLQSKSGTVCVHTPAPTTTKKRTTTATTTTHTTTTPRTTSTPKPKATPAPAPAPQPDPEPAYNDSGDDCGVGILLLGPLGMAAC